MHHIVTDQMQRKVKIPTQPKRIISLVPSQTELLFYLGLDKEVIGITKFCVHPHVMFKSKPRVGGTKQYNFEKIKSLEPDLIIGNKEENDQTQIELLEKEYPVWMSDIFNVEDALEMILEIGKIVNRKAEAKVLIEKITDSFRHCKKVIQQLIHRPRVAYFIWKNPTMVAASQTFIHEMLEIAGFENIFATESRYPQISDSKLAAAQPEVILLSSEPFPFKEKHIKEIQAICPDADIRLVDGEIFSWYGNRLLLAGSYLENLRLSFEKQNKLKDKNL
ncbi:MAG: ABC transporter substrate-binding protein [Saprospiraceae bacterium]